MSDIEKPDVIGATRRAETIRIGMVGWAAAQDAIAEAYEAKDWITLGYKSWNEYVEKEFAEKRLKLTRDQRSEAVEVFRLVGMSQREIATTLDVSRNTVAKQVAQSEPPADPVDSIPDEAKAAIQARLDRTAGPASTLPDGGSGENTPADQPEPSDTDGHSDGRQLRAGADAGQPEVDHPESADPGEAEDSASSAADGHAPAAKQAGSEPPSPEDSGPADGREQQDPAGGVPAPAAPVPPKPEGAVADDPERVQREMRERMTQTFCEGLVALTLGLPDDPVPWLEEVYLPGVYKDHGIDRVAKCFTASSIKSLASVLFQIGDYMHETGMELK